MLCFHLLFFPVPSASPTNLQIIIEGPNNLTVFWERPREIEVNGKLLGYAVEYHALEESDPDHFNRVNVSTYFVYLNGLANFTYYNVSVRAYTIIGVGPPIYGSAKTYENGMYCM